MRLLKPVIEKHGYIFSALCVTFSTGLFFLGRDNFAKGQWALFYLLIIGLVAGISGVRPALLAAGLSFFAWNYFFLPPFHTFVIADPKDWISLVVFLVVGISVGLLTGRMRERESEALAREKEMILLNRFSAHLVSETTIFDMADALVKEVERTANVKRVMLFILDKDGCLQSVNDDADETEIDPYIKEIAQWVRNESKAVGLPVHNAKSESSSFKWPISISFLDAGFQDRHDIFIPLQTTSRLEGVLYIGERADGKLHSLKNAQLLVAVANQAAAFLERKQLQSIAVQADVLREADKLKTTLVSSVSHELKTPLASVTATISNLLEQDMEWNNEHVREELEAVEEDLQRLNNSIGALLDLSRLESAAWEPHKELFEFGEILGTAMSKIPQKLRSRVKFVFPEELPMIKVDFLQWTRVLQNLIENALNYSPVGSDVQIGASANSLAFKIWVEDKGPGIPSEEKERIFEKFYRGKAAPNVPSGTGLGLAVTREIVKSHGGKIWVEDVAPRGARMVISLLRENK